MRSLIESNRGKIQELCDRFGVGKLEVFGSVAAGSFDPAKSDMDFLVVFKPSSPGDHAHRYFGLLAGLQDLFQKDVDLIEIRAIRNPYFRQSVERDRVIIYEARS